MLRSKVNCQAIWRHIAVNSIGGRVGQQIYSARQEERLCWLRKVVAHVVPFMLYCVVIPLSVLIPEVTVPVWGVVYIPTAITLLYAIRNPRFVSSRSIYLTPDRICANISNSLLISVLSTSYRSGSSSRMLCLSTGRRRHSSVCLSSGV